MLVAGGICGSLVISTCCACCCLQYKRRKATERRRRQEEEKGKEKRKTEEREDSGRDHDEEGRTVSSDTLSQWRDHVQGRKVSSTYTTSTYAASTNTY